MTSLRRASLLLLVATCLAAGACAQGEVTPGADAGGGEGADASGARDGGAMRDAAMTTNDGGATRDGGGGGGRDAAMTTCPMGQHPCGAGCVADLANEPENGCRLGCGEPCEAPDDAAATCGMDGRCSWDCAPPFRRVGDACECAPTTCEALRYECGAPDDGCGMPLDCGACMDGAACTTGRCACTADMFEPNDSNTSPTERAGLNDADDPPDVILAGNLDDADDEDWFRFPINDGTDGGAPRITVTLRNIPLGSDYALSAYYVCGDSRDDSSCSMGAPDNFVGRGCTGAITGSGPEVVEIETDCARTFSLDDSGTLYVRVRAAEWMTTCGPYEAVVRVR